MNKKTQKGLVAAITATMGAGIVAPAAMAAVDPVAAARQAVEKLESAEKYQNAKEIEACRALVKNLTDAKAKNELTIRINRVMLGEYNEATAAVKKAKETRTQKDVSLAYNEAVNLTNDDAVRRGALINALNVIQKELYTKVDKALAKADTELKQEYLNEAQAIIKDMLNPWRKPREAKYTQLQVKIYVSARTALQTAKNSGLKADYEIAKALYEDVKTVTNNNTVAGWVKNVLTPLFESIVLDSTNPVVTGVEEGKAYNTAVTPASEEEGLTATLTRNGEVVEYTFGEEITEEGVYELNVFDANENVTTLHFTVDMTAPVFKYDGETTINVKYGEVFTLPTMEASELSAVITPVIVDENDKVVEKIDTKVPGMYTVTYTAVDAAGNSTEITLIVVVAENSIKVESVSAVTNTNTFTVTLAEEVKAEDLAGKKLVLTPATGTAVEATFKSLEGKVATFEFATATAEGEYVITGEGFEIAEGTKVVYDKTAPTVKVADSKFTNYQTMTIALSEKVTGTPVVKINGTEEPAANVALAADGMSLTVTRNAGFAAGTYTVVVNGLKDEATNAMTVDATLTVVKAASYINDFNFTTTGLAKGSTQRVYFTVVDQYGQDVTSNMAALDDNLAVTGTMGTFPLTITHSNGNAYVVITDTLVKDKEVSLTLTNKDADGKVIGNSKTFTAKVADVTLVPTSIANITTADGKVEYEAGTTNKVLTATVLDQFGNPIALNADTNNRSVRWVIDNTDVVRFNGQGASVTVKDGVQNSATIGIDTIAKGTATIRAFLPDGTEVGTPLVINVTSKALTSLSGGTFGGTLYNMEEQVSTQIVQNSGAELVPSQLKTKITSMPSGATESDLVVTYAYGTGDNADKIYATVKTNKVGTYKFVTYVGETYETRTAANTEVVVTTVANPVVDAITLETISEKELTAGSSITKAITFRNVHGEVVDVLNENLTANGSTGLTVTKAEADKSSAENGDAVKFITFSAPSAGNYTATIMAGTKTLSVNVPVQAAAALTNVTLDSTTASVIKNDKEPLASDDNQVYVAADDIAYKLVPVTFNDQYGNKMAVGANAIDLTVAGADANYKVAAFSASKDKVTDATAVAYIGYAYKVGDATLPTTGKVVTVSSKGDPTKKADITINVTDSRRVDSLVSSLASGNVAVGGYQDYVISGVDQYGNSIDVTTTNIKMIAASNNEYSVAYTNIDAVAGVNKAMVKVRITGNVASTVAYSPVIYFDTNADGQYNASTEKSVALGLTVKEIGDAVTSVNINPIASVDTEAESAFNTDLSKYAAKITQNKNGNAITFSATAKDANGNTVALPNDAVLWSVVSNNLKYDTNTAQVSVKFDNTTKNKLVIDNAVDELVSGTVTVRAIVNGKSQDLTFSVSSSNATAQKGGYSLATTATGTDTVDGILVSTKVTSEIINSGDVDGVQKLYLVGTDQYGQTNTALDENAVLGVSQDSSVYFTGVKASNEFSITAKEVGTSTFRVFVDGQIENNLAITITVSQEGLAARKVKLAETAAQSLSTPALANAAKTAFDAAQVAVSALPNDIAPVTTKATLQGRLDAIKIAVDTAKSSADSAIADLTAKIAEVATVEAGKVEGSAVGNQVVGSKAILDAAKATAQTILDNASTTPIATINNATSTLNTAIEAYKVAKVTAAAITSDTVTVTGTASSTTTVTVNGTTETLVLLGANTAVATATKVDSTGVITITGVAAGTYNLTVNVLDGAGHVIRTVNVTVTVN